MSPQESDEDKSDYNLVVDEVSQGPGSSCSDLSSGLGTEQAVGYLGELGGLGGVGAWCSPLCGMAGMGMLWGQGE